MTGWARPKQTGRGALIIRRGSKNRRPRPHHRTTTTTTTIIIDNSAIIFLYIVHISEHRAIQFINHSNARIILLIVVIIITTIVVYTTIDNNINFFFKGIKELSLPPKGEETIGYSRFTPHRYENTHTFSNQNKPHINSDNILQNKNGIKKEIEVLFKLQTNPLCSSARNNEFYIQRLNRYSLHHTNATLIIIIAFIKHGCFIAVFIFGITFSSLLSSSILSLLSSSPRESAVPVSSFTSKFCINIRHNNNNNNGELNNDNGQYCRCNPSPVKLVFCILPDISPNLQETVIQTIVNTLSLRVFSILNCVILQSSILDNNNIDNYKNNVNNAMPNIAPSVARPGPEQTTHDISHISAYYLPEADWSSAQPQFILQAFQSKGESPDLKQEETLQLDNYHHQLHHRRKQNQHDEEYTTALTISTTKMSFIPPPSSSSSSMPPSGEESDGGGGGENNKSGRNFSENIGRNAGGGDSRDSKDGSSGAIDDNRFRIPPPLSSASSISSQHHHQPARTPPYHQALSSSLSPSSSTPSTTIEQPPSVPKQQPQNASCPSPSTSHSSPCPSPNTSRTVDNRDACRNNNNIPPYTGASAGFSNSMVSTTATSFKYQQQQQHSSSNPPHLQDHYNHQQQQTTNSPIPTNKSTTTTRDNHPRPIEPLASIERCQEFHGILGPSSPLLSPASPSSFQSPTHLQVATSAASIRARHFSGGELPSRHLQHHLHQQHLYHHHKLQQHQYQQHVQTQSSGLRPSFYGSAPFLTQGTQASSSSATSTCGISFSSLQSKQQSPLIFSSSFSSSSSSSSISSTVTTVALSHSKDLTSSSSAPVMMEQEDSSNPLHSDSSYHHTQQPQQQEHCGVREEEEYPKPQVAMDITPAPLLPSESSRKIVGVGGDDTVIPMRRSKSPSLTHIPRSFSGGNINEIHHLHQQTHLLHEPVTIRSSSLSSSSSSLYSPSAATSSSSLSLHPPSPLAQTHHQHPQQQQQSPSSSSASPTHNISYHHQHYHHHHAIIANLPEIQMTEMVSEADQVAPWISHTPDNLSPTVQIVQKLAQATVSDKRSTGSGSVTTSPGDTSPRLAKFSGLQIPTPDRSPSLSPTSATKHRQLFVFPDVVAAQLQQQQQQHISKSHSAGALTTAPPTLESAGLNVSLAALKSERWRHMSSGSSGDSSTAGELSGATLSSVTSGHLVQGGPGSSSSTPGAIGSGSKRHRFFSGDTNPDDNLIDSETGSSVVEDSGSSREQSPFSLVPDISCGGNNSGGMSTLCGSGSPSPRHASPSGRRSSPSGRKNLHRQYGMTSEDDGEGFGIHPSSSSSGISEGERGGSGGYYASEDERLQPPKFKRRLHERYVSSLKDEPMGFLGNRSGDDSSSYSLKTTSSSFDSAIDIKPVLKVESVDDDDTNYSQSSLPKSPRRSVTDESSLRTDSYELSADEGDVFMEPVRSSSSSNTTSQQSSSQQQMTSSQSQPLHQKRMKSINQQKPLDLSQSTPTTPTTPGTSQQQQQHYRTSSLSDPPDTPSSTKSHYSPFRSPYRLNFSPQGLMSPQASQSPLCSVPEGGRIFSFNVPSTPGASTGGQSDSEGISPSPLSPRFFTFPSIVPSQSSGQLLNPNADINRLAVSPRALYPTSPIHLPLKSKSVSSQFKWESLSKRSLSDSDVAYQCPICGQVFPSNDNLAKHMAKHLPTETIRSGDNNNKVHYCKVCDRSFSRSDMLTRHMRLHTGLKPYECVDCGQVFSRSDHLNTHKRTHTGEKPYRCPECPYAACRRDMITRHMRTHVKRTPKRNRYLSVPDDSSTSKSSTTAASPRISGSDLTGLVGSGGGGSRTHSVSSTDAMSESSYITDGHPTGRACSSLSSIDSLDLEIGVSSSSSGVGTGSSHQRDLASGRRNRRSRMNQASVESIPLTDDSSLPATTHPSSSSHDSEELEEIPYPVIWATAASTASSSLGGGGGGGGGGPPSSPGYATSGLGGPHPSLSSGDDSRYHRHHHRYGSIGAGDDDAFVAPSDSSSSTSSLPTHQQHHQYHHHHHQEFHIEHHQHHHQQQHLGLGTGQSPHEKRPREPSPHPRGYFYPRAGAQLPQPPPSP